jgi:SHS2 domain-containing protein
LQYEFFDVTADIGIRAWGENINKAFENASIALFELITNTSQIKPITEKIIVLDAEDEEALLYDWLSELIFLHDSEYLVFNKFKIEINETSEKKFQIKAKAWGEEFNPELHEIRDEVKAITFHLMKIEKEDGCRVQLIVDV